MSGTSPPPGTRNRWVIASAAVVMQMCLGIIYSWSVFREPLASLHGWSPADTSAPYQYSLLFFTFGMIVGGLWQDRKGPRLVGSVGGLLLGTGCVLAALMGDTLNGLIFAYGVVGGVGVGFGYVTPIATCVKWFPDRRGFIVGLAVMGFGAGMLILAPLMSALIGTNPELYAQTLPRTFLVMGIILYVFVIGAAQFFAVPPAGWRPAGWTPPTGSAAASTVDFTTAQMLRTWQFYVLWAIFLLGASVGLSVIGQAKPYMLNYVGAADAAATIALSTLAVFNGAGRLLWGAFSDRAGRMAATAGMGLLMAVGCAVFLRTGSDYALGLIGLCIVGFCYGGYLATMPAFCADYYGPKNMGLNYGMLFTAFGVAGFFAPGYFAGILTAAGENVTAGYSTIYLQMSVAAVVAMALALIPRKPVRPAPAQSSAT
ncbi:MAG TPA: OFA family MFS transporter [Chthonomonadales bacterium]|nr:OFA family MFS transporter [Chthonomonadales bacterium]